MSNLSNPDENAEDLAEAEFRLEESLAAYHTLARQKGITVYCPYCGYVVLEDGDCEAGCLS